jgi:predicted Zn-dependent protease with MMP-like domain
MTRDRFRQLVSDALDTIPARFRRHLRNIAVVVEDEPSAALLHEMDIEPPDTLFGLYQGTPLTERHWDHGNVLPDRIVIFQGPIEDVSETEDDVVTEIGETLIHEVGHYFGMDEEQIEEIEDRYWNRRQETGAGSRTAAGAEEDEAEDGLESGDDEDER